MPSSWLGTPAVSRRTMLGGVRTESNTSLAPPSARSTAISAPELPLPDDEHATAAVGGGIAILGRVDDLAVERARPVRHERHVALPRRHHDPLRSDGPLDVRTTQPFACLSTRSTSTPVRTSSRDGRRTASDTRRPGHARATVRTPAGSRSREGPTASERCAGAACRTGRPRPRPSRHARGRRHARRSARASRRPRARTPPRR